MKTATIDSRLTLQTEIMYFYQVKMMKTRNIFELCGPYWKSFVLFCTKYIFFFMLVVLFPLLTLLSEHVSHTHMHVCVSPADSSPSHLNLAWHRCTYGCISGSTLIWVGVLARRAEAELVTIKRTGNQRPAHTPTFTCDF